MKPCLGAQPARMVRAMDTHWRQHHLPEMATALASRRGHNETGTMIAELLHHEFGASYPAIDHEVRMPEVRGRADALFGSTVFEFKKDLRREEADARRQLADYLGERERKTGGHYLGIATDGATFIAYELREGGLFEMRRLTLQKERPADLLAWLELAISDRDELPPEPIHVQLALGRDSLTYERARGVLTRLWSELETHPEVRLKRQLWDGLLRLVCTTVGDDTLFLQHTYLTIVAKTVAVRVLDLRADDPEAILSGRMLDEQGIHGAVEGDFFDWVLQHPDGRDLVLKVARQVARFRLRDVQADVLKALTKA